MKRTPTDIPPLAIAAGLVVVEWRGEYIAWYSGLCGFAACCPLLAAARCLAHAAENAGQFGWFREA